MSDIGALLSAGLSLPGPAGAGPVRPVARRSLANPLAREPVPGIEATSVSAADGEDFDDEGTLVVEQRFAIVPEWIIDADISDSAYRLYSILLRYGQTSGKRMPGRALLAQRLRKRSKDTVDRAMIELVAIGAVRVERRRQGRQNLTNRYHLMSTPPGTRRQQTPSRPQRSTPAASAVTARGGRKDAATPGPTSAATVAAGMRPDPGASTERTPPPPSPSPAPAPPDSTGGGGGETTKTASTEGDPSPGADASLVENLDALAAECQRLRRGLGLPAARWAPPRLVEVLHEAVAVRGWPAAAAGPALLAVAADPATKSPMRLTCPGPWWEAAEHTGEAEGSAERSADELAALEARLIEVGGLRVSLQQRARRELAAKGIPANRLSVSRRACELLDRTGEVAS